jgi:hypothetical protein
MSAINAKGYDAPVSIYAPISENPVTKPLYRRHSLDTYYTTGKSHENLKEFFRKRNNEKDNEKRIQKINEDEKIQKMKNFENEKINENSKVKGSCLLAPKPFLLAPKPYVKGLGSLFHNEEDNRVESRSKKKVSPVIRGMYIYTCTCMYMYIHVRRCEIYL